MDLRVMAARAGASWWKPFRTLGTAGGEGTSGAIGTVLQRPCRHPNVTGSPRRRTGAGHRPLRRSGWMDDVSARSSRVVILGGGPGGYEAALVAAHLGAEVTVVERDGLGGAAVLTDCVPSKTLISTADYMSDFETAHELGVHLEDAEGDEVADAVADLREVNARVLDLAAAQSDDIATRLAEVGCGCSPAGRVLTSPTTVRAETADGCSTSRPTWCSSPPAPPRGSWTPHAPTASASSPGSRSTTSTPCPSGSSSSGRASPAPSWPRPTSGWARRSCSSPRATGCFPARTPTPPRSSRTSSPSAGWRCSAARGWRPSSAPPTASSCASRTAARSPGRTRCWRWARCRTPAASGWRTSGSSSRHPALAVDRVSRTSVRGVYAAGDCTGVLPLASVAAMQGRIAMSHALGDAVAPLNLRVVSANIFTDPEIATVGVSQKDVDDEVVDAEVLMLPLSPQRPREDARHHRRLREAVRAEGFRRRRGRRRRRAAASELIFPVTLAVQHRLNVDQVASTFTVYPSLSGSIAEAARRLHATD